MQIGDLLVAAGIVSPQKLHEAQRQRGTLTSTLAENLVASGAVDAATLKGFLDRVPEAPSNMAETGLSEAELLNLLMKLIYVDGVDTTSAFIEASKLPYVVLLQILDIATQRGLMAATGTSGPGGLADVRYVLSEAGRNWANDALQQSQYVGPVPVSLEDYKRVTEMQKVSRELVTHTAIEAAMQGLVISPLFIDQIGPAVNSGRTMLLYGPPGNGKTSVALRLRHVFSATVYVPYAVSVGGRVMRVFDPALHEPLPAPPPNRLMRTFPPIRRDAFDSRWIPCKRPFVITGGELTLEMLDLRYEGHTNYCEAPLHVKAQGGCIVVDDFGRQMVTPAQLLNRWITPLENRIDFLKLNTGKTIALPFEELVIFSTNLQPEDLMDEAFLRRIPYKLEVPGPSREEFRTIFDAAAENAGLILTDEIFDYVVAELTTRKHIRLARYHAGFIISQILVACRYHGVEPQFDRQMLDNAISNVRVNHSAALV
jgi:hypothetical protein